jgi:thymidylate synthase (FAD)
VELKLITEPKVYVVGRQSIDFISTLNFRDNCELKWHPQWATDNDPDDPSPAEHLIEMAGRLCYMSFNNPRPGGNEAYIKHILEVGHGSVLEHAVWNFVITGVSRSLTHELIRHRAGWGYSELSQRYVDCSDVAFVVPPAMMDWHDAWKERLRTPVEKACVLADKEIDAFLGWRMKRIGDVWEYQDLTEKLLAKAPAELTGTERRKWARQAARSVLPNCTETKIFATANARAIRHFLEMRGSRHADAEIRRLANVILDVMQKESSTIFGDYKRVDLGDGAFEITTEWKKV